MHEYRAVAPLAALAVLLTVLLASAPPSSASANFNDAETLNFTAWDTVLKRYVVQGANVKSIFRT
jgi:hypothetical protein